MLKGNKVWTPNGYQSGPVNSLVGKGSPLQIILMAQELL